MTFFLFLRGIRLRSTKTSELESRGVVWSLYRTDRFELEKIMRGTSENFVHEIYPLWKKFVDYKGDEKTDDKNWFTFLEYEKNNRI